MLPPSLSAPPQKISRGWVAKARSGPGAASRGSRRRPGRAGISGRGFLHPGVVARSGFGEQLPLPPLQRVLVASRCGDRLFQQGHPVPPDRASKAPGAPSTLHFHLILVPRGFWGAELPARLSRPSTEAGISPLLFPRPGRAEPSGMAQCPQRRRLRRGTRTNRGHLTPNPPRGLCWLPPAAELSGAFPDE